MDKIVLGTRGSPLALKQANDVRAKLESLGGIEVELVVIKTTGDLRTSERFKEIGTKGLFTKELDEALLAKKIDFAVHSMKDLPSEVPPGLTLACVPQAVDRRDAWVCPTGHTLASLPAGSKVGTSSLRRRALVRLYRPDLVVEECRGNVETRLSKVQSAAFDAILLACAGLTRLGLAEHITQRLDPTRFFPAAGQGMIAIVCREDDPGTLGRLDRIRDAASGARALAERYFLSGMDGGCSVPLGCHLEEVAAGYRMIGFLGRVHAESGELVEHMIVETHAPNASEASRNLVQAMKDRGAEAWIREMKGER